MFAVNVIIGSVCIPFMFRQEETARAAASQLTHDPTQAFGMTRWISLVDDFGHELAVESKSISGFILEDMDKTKLAHVERALHQERTQRLVQKTAEADPGLRMSSSKLQNGPGILTPFPHQH